MNTYWKTTLNGEEAIHLAFNSGTAVCGFDLVGDDTIHDVPPERMNIHFHLITCLDCLAIMSAVNEHFQHFLLTAKNR